MNGHYLEMQVRSRVVGPIIAFREYVFRDVLPAFGNLSERADQVTEEYYNRIGSMPAGEDCDIDMADVAEDAHQQAFSWYEVMTSLRQTRRNLLAAGLFHLVEQQLASREARLAGVAWQRCEFHLQQNAGHYAPRISMRSQVAADLRAIFDAPGRAEADRQLELAVRKYEKTAPKLAAWLSANVPESLTVFAFPAAHQRRLRTSNLLERLNKEIKRRTRVATLFPNEAALLRLVSAVLMEISQEWETGKIYLRMENSSLIAREE